MQRLSNVSKVFLGWAVVLLLVLMPNDRTAAAVEICVPPPSGMAGWWPGDNNANDLVGTDHGTLVNGATFATGKVASAFSLLGTNDYVNVPNSPQLNPGTGSFSVDAWIQTSAVGFLTDILDKRTRTNGYTGYALFVHQGRLGMQLAVGGASGGFTNYISTSPMIADGVWHHVAATVDRPTGGPAVGRLIVDGSVALTFVPRLGSLSNTADLNIGRESFGGFNFQGLVDEVEFFNNRALSVPEVANIYNAGSAGKCKAPTDTTPPIITPTVTGTLGNNGWYTSDVLVSWSVTDGESAITSKTGCDTTSVSADTIGITLTCTATSTGGTASKSVTIKRDATPPDVTYSGNAGTYTVDQTVSITCLAGDALSGIAAHTCQDISGDAYTFPLGTNTFSASATDNAGLVGSGSTSFEVVVTYDSLCNLVKRFVANKGIANSLCVKLQNAEAAEARGDLDAKNGILGAFVNEVQAQSGKALTADHADILIGLAGAL